METVATLVASLFVGIDWASQEHAVHVMDTAGRKAAVFTIEHTREGLETLVKRLASLGPVGELPVAIERPDGRLVDALLEAGHPVVPVQPNAIKAWRDGEVISGAKTDESDAELIAEYLRLRQHRLAVAAPYSDETRALRAVVRSRGDLVDARVAAHNQLEACLDAFWPGAKAVFADVTSEIALAFLERYPTPASARLLGEKRMAAFTTRHGYSGKRPAAVLLERLRAAPEGVLAGAEAEARRDGVLGYVKVVRALNASIRDLTRSVIAHLDEHPDGAIFTSLPRSGQVNAAQMLAGWGDCREAYDSPEAVSALAGLVPVTKASGKHRQVAFRWACNTRFRVAMTTFADNSRHASEWAASVYQGAVDRGCDHPHAVRILARAWARVIYRCWVERVPYDAAVHGAAVRLQEQRTEAA